MAIDKQRIKEMLNPSYMFSPEKRAARVMPELESRKQDALSLYRPYGKQVDFHKSQASEKILRGGNRSGKTISSAAEIASAALGQPIIGTDDEPLPFRYPTNYPLTIWLIGYGEKHIAQTLHRALFRPGLFDIILDNESGRWRALNPNNQEDIARKARGEARPAPPLIPKRMIAGWGWKSRAQRLFTSCTLVNGTMIYAFTSNAEPKQGDPVDLIWVDEDIAIAEHVSEWQARLTDRKGKIIWSAFPHGENNALRTMSRRAQEEAKLQKANPDIEEFQLISSNNPFLDKNELRKRHAGWSAKEIRARDYGEFVDDVVRVFPSFDPVLHCVPSMLDDKSEKTDRILRANGLRPPDDWTRYLALDPGHTHPAILFGAVPPPELGDWFYIYDEIYLSNADAYRLAKEAASRMGGQNFEKFVIDDHAGRQTIMGCTWTVKQQYAMAFQKEALNSNQTEHTFENGTDNIPAAMMLIRSWLLPRENMQAPKLRIIEEQCPHLIGQIIDYKKKVKQDETTDDPIKVNCDLVDALRYLCGANPVYVKPNPSNKTISPSLRIFREWQQKDKPQRGSIMLGPAA